MYYNRIPPPPPEGSMTRRPPAFRHLIACCFVVSTLAGPALAAEDHSSAPSSRAALPRDLAAALAAAPPARRFASGEILAILHPDTPLVLQMDGRARSLSPAVDTALSRHGLDRFTYLRGAAPSTGLHRRYIRLQSNRPDFNPEAAAAELRATGLFRAVIPNYSVPLFATLPNDPLLAQQWHINTVGPADIKLPEAWDLAQGSASVKIGIMDTGIDYTHIELNGTVWVNTAEPTNGVDDDGNGFIDDRRGWDFGMNDRIPLPEMTIDGSGWTWASTARTAPASHRPSRTTRSAWPAPAGAAPWCRSKYPTPPAASPTRRSPAPSSTRSTTASTSSP
jgi:hypothetical protein